jgi:predicted phosphodiesterase
MKIAFISDIHGNAVALDAVLDDIQALGAERIVVMGDLCYRGPEPKRALNRIRELNCSVIKGNADEWTVRGVGAGEVPDALLERMNRERDWTVSQLDAGDIDYLNTLPVEWSLDEKDLPGIHAFHATPDSLFDIVKPDTASDELEARLMRREETELYLYAHIHLPYVRYLKGKCVANLGSVGLPFDGMPRSSYLLVNVKEDGPDVMIRRVAYDIEKTIDLYRRHDYPNIEQMVRIVRSGKFST